MEDLKTQIFKLTSGFVEEISDLAHRHTDGVLAAAFDSVSRAPEGRSKVNGAPGALSVERTRGIKRDPAALEQLGERFVKFVRDNPGLRIEQINKKVDASTAELALPIRKLIASGEISTQGQKRSTTYFVTDSKRTRATAKATATKTAKTPKRGSRKGKASRGSSRSRRRT